MAIWHYRWYWVSFPGWSLFISFGIYWVLGLSALSFPPLAPTASLYGIHSLEFHNLWQGKFSYLFYLVQSYWQRWYDPLEARCWTIFCSRPLLLQRGMYAWHDSWSDEDCRFHLTKYCSTDWTISNWEDSQKQFIRMVVRMCIAGITSSVFFSMSVRKYRKFDGCGRVGKDLIFGIVGVFGKSRWCSDMCFLLIFNWHIITQKMKPKSVIIFFT